MRTFVSMIALSAALMAMPAAAQDYEAMALQMEQAQAEAQAAASRPGDEALTCEQLEVEMTTAMDDPAVHAVMEQNGAFAEGQMERMREAQGRARAQIATSMFMGIASSFIPGLGYAQMAQQQVQAAEMQRQQQQNMADMMAMSERMSSIMPQLMRGQRIYELGQAKSCAFTQAQAPAEAPQN